MGTMTPDLFHIDYGRLLETLITIVVLSFLLERTLAVVFESRLFIDWAEGNAANKKQKKKGVREIIAVAVAVAFCLLIKFDAITIILQSNDHMTVWGMVMTGFILSGGSKASIALFHNLMGVMSTAEKARKEVSEAATRRELIARQTSL